MSAFAERLLAWFDASGRHDLPWQHPRTPYRVWVAEIMLQQTQVQTAIPYYTRFLDALPSLPDLAAAELDRVLALWSGLGYYARARNLHRAARICVERHGGELPRDIDALQALPGIGRSTAGAILAQAHGLRFAILDGNVKRSLARYHGIRGWPGSGPVEKRLWELSESHLPQTRLADYTQAVMDFGATVCTRSDPACVLCPLQDDCVARREGLVDRLPEPKPGKPLPERRTIMLVLRDGDGRLLLTRRPPTGIWACLWSLPEVADHDQARHWLARHCDADYDHAEPLPVFEHVFSHFRLHIEPMLLHVTQTRTAVGDNPDLRWQPLAALDDLGLPAPVRKLLGSLA
ncbi:A/G-specific adenine glycosylase [Rehaibacterium terrae]|uniref:Adenine DNA glycosylase n=1 Tax=Rehaibacterium terrae TaxID=1341696 RepID=A0A7W7Y094_9GAMM|nr:A/G-specific adenine glycosylase [Rehaibacterium terrae]